MELTVYSMCWVILIYGFIGWCTEVVYAAVCEGKFVNRGFLNGPICPIYGVGMLVVLLVLTPIKDNIILLFLGGVALTSTLEYFTGFVLEKLFKMKWWDYSDTPFNLHGYVCLKFSILWGFGVVFVMKIVNKPIELLITKVPHMLGMILLFALAAFFIADMVLTLIGILKLPQRIRAMEEIEAALTKISDEIGEKLYISTSKAIEQDEKLKPIIKEKRTELEESFAQKRGELQETFDEKRADLQKSLETTRAELEEKYKSLVKSGSFVGNRILSAFPKLAEPRKSVKQKFSELKDKFGN